MEKLSAYVGRLGEKIGLDLNYFINSSFWLTVEQFIQAVSGLIISIILAALLTTSSFGLYGFFLSLLSILSIFSLPGVNHAIIQANSRGLDGTYKEGIIAKMKFSLIASAILFAAAIYFFVSDISTSMALIVIAAVFPIYSLSSVYRAHFLALGRFNKIAQVSILYHLCYIAAIGLTVYFYKSATALIMTNVLLAAFLGIYSIFIIARLRNNDRDEASIPYGKSLSASTIFNKIADYADNIIIGGFLGFSELAIFSVATLLPGIIKNATLPLTEGMLPKLSRLNINVSNKMMIWRHVLKMLIPVSAVILVFVLFLPVILELFFPKYKDTVITFSIIYSLSFLTLPIAVIQSHFIAAKKSRQTFVIRLAYALSVIILTPTLIYFLGVTGAILARVTVRVIMFFVIAITFELSFAHPSDFSEIN